MVGDGRPSRNGMSRRRRVGRRRLRPSAVQPTQGKDRELVRGRRTCEKFEPYGRYWSRRPPAWCWAPTCLPVRSRSDRLHKRSRARRNSSGARTWPAT